MRLLLGVSLMMLFAWSSFAHDVGEHPPDMRIWKDVDGLFELEASFVLARDEQVQLHKHDGSLVWLPLAKLSKQDREWVQTRVEAIRLLNGEYAAPSASPVPLVVAMVTLVALAAFSNALRKRAVALPLILFVALVGTLIATAADTNADKAKIVQKQFDAFKDKVKFRSDADYFYIESNGMPDHKMMVGITAWQQQVPIPQKYTGANAWRIPLNPRFAEKPVSAKKALFRGAIAIAVNGVPIFNPIKNDGKTDTLIAGELDEFGGHCGRADDYHYHIGPVHLEKVVGKGNPIGYALDGFPLYGYTDANGKEPNDLDEFNGRMENGSYRYYSTKKYPYINGGMKGVVTVRDDQIDPQPRAYSPRAALTPLRGAKITDFDYDEKLNTATLKYEISGQANYVTYSKTADGYTFVFKDSSGKTRSESFSIREDGRRPPPPKKDDRPKKDGPPAKKEERPAAKKDERPQDKFLLNSPAFEHHGKMPVEFTGDGDGASPPLKWSNAPAGTKFFALHLWHKPQPDGDEVKSYWVISNIPANVTSLEKNTKGVGVVGHNGKKRTGYDPMNSKGPGEKEYHITMYALSAEPKFANDKFTREDLLKAIKDITLAESTLSYTYERKGKP